MAAALLRFVARLTTAASMVALPLASGLAANPALPAFAEREDSLSSDCRLQSADGNIQHLVWLQFDNVHFTRDNLNVPSDLEQMPNLLNFIQSNGTLLSNHHTPLIAHTATDILTTLTGVYGDRHGVSVSNSYRYFRPDGTSNPAGSFTYWTAPLVDFTNPAVKTDTTFNMLAANSKNAPARRRRPLWQEQ